MRKMAAWQRKRVLQQLASRCRERADELAHLLVVEAGKPVTFARSEVERLIETVEIAAEEATRIYGEVLPLDAARNGAGKFGMAVRVPCGVVVAITPFNFPMLLVLHKIASALAVGNAVILKPASATPLVALRLSNGSVAWLTQLKGEDDRFIDVDSTPVVVGDTLYVTSSSGGVWALDKTTGLVRWRMPL